MTFNYNGSFYKTKANLADQGRKAMFSVLMKTRKLAGSSSRYPASDV